MAFQTSHRSFTDPPEGDGWFWSTYGDCWRRQYDQRKFIAEGEILIARTRSKPKTTKTTTKRKKPVRKPKTAKTLSAGQTISLAVVISLFIILIKLFT